MMRSSMNRASYQVQKALSTDDTGKPITPKKKRSKAPTRPTSATTPKVMPTPKAKGTATPIASGFSPMRGKKAC